MAAARRPSADELDRLLPQTQCRRCGHEGCRPYAQAMALGEAPGNRCPPGGESMLQALSARLSAPLLPLAPETGTIGPPRVAVIDEAACIGCAKCLPACPVDAIVGARRQMHTVIRDECSGCELCIAPCPVDCIVMVPSADAPLGADEIARRAEGYRARYVAHNERVARVARAREERLGRAAPAPGGAP